MSSLVLAVVPLVSLVLAQSVTSPEPARAEDVLARLESTLGDADARTRARNLVITGKVSAEPMMPGEGDFEEVYAGADQARWTIGFPGMGSMTQGSTGKFSWSTDPALGVMIRDGDAQASVLRQFAVYRRAGWKTMFEKAELVGKTKLDERDAFELKMIPKTGASDTWFVDAQTWTLSRIDTRLPDPSGGEIPLQYHFSEWKAVGGILYPHVRKQKLGGFEVVYRVKSIEHPKELDPARVAPSGEVLAAHADPKKRSKTLPEKPGEFTVTKVEPQPVASVRVTCAESDISRTLASILPEVMGHVTAVGADMAGPPFSRYHARKDGKVDLEAGIPVKKKIEGKGRIQAGELPGGETAIGWHFGQYHDLAKTYGQLEAWMKSQSLESRGGMWEVYWTDPGIEPDPSKWKTQLLWPVKAR